MDDYHLNGWVPDPDSDEYWSYEDQLKNRMMAVDAGDVDLRPFTSPRHNQRSTGSCVAQAVVKALEIKRIMQHGMDAHVDLSILAVYYLSREMMFPKQTHLDNGTYISLGCDTLRRFGVPTDATWTWGEKNVFMKPSWSSMRDAYVHKIQSFYRITSRGQDRVDEVVRCLRAGNPVVYGTTVGNNWFSYRKTSISGILPGPLKVPFEIKGRHATVLLGWEDGVFLGENSWGNGWGDDGFYRMDPSVIASKDSSDFWVIQGGWEEYEDES